jgi:hypothetical protein
MDLPDSTADIAIGLLNGRTEMEGAIAWAGDLLVLGLDDDVVVRLAVLDRNDWQVADSLVQAVARLVGLDPTERPALYRWIERSLLQAYLGGALDESDLIDCGYNYWSRLLDSQEGPANPFLIYNDLGDRVSIETGGRDVDALRAQVDPRRWVIAQLIEDGAFDRTDLPIPEVG